MNKIVEVLENKTDLIKGNPVSEKDIVLAQERLKIKFAEDYAQYLMNYGIVAYEGHEITGLSKSERTNVVCVTEKIRNAYQNLLEDLYVIEETNIDDIIIWQSSDGYVYMTIGDSVPRKVYKSLAEYMAE